MKLKVLFLILFSIYLLVSSVTAYEDFTTYEVLDEQSDFTITSNLIVASGVAPTATSYIYYDFTATPLEYFTQNFTLNTSAGNAGGAAVIWGLTNNHYFHIDANTSNDGMSLYLYQGSTYYRIYLYDYAYKTTLTYIDIAIGVEYFATINRSESNLNLKLYTDSERTNLYSSTNQVVSNDAFNNLFAVMGQNNTGGSTLVSFRISNSTIYIPNYEAPIILSYAPETPNSTHENVVATYNATIDQISANNEWLINGSIIEWDNSTDSPEYTNSTWLNGTYNLTLISHNSTDHSLTDSQTWIVTVLLNSVDIEVTYFDRTNLSYNIIWNVTNITAGLQYWNVSYNATDAGNTYFFRYWNNTYIGINQTATSTNETKWFNFSSLLPEGVYYLSEIEGADPSLITISCSGWAYIAMNYTSKTLGDLDTILSNDVVQAGYDSSLQRYKIHRTGRALNANYNVTQRWGYTAYFSSATNVYVTIPETISAVTLLTGWNLVGHLSTTNTTITAILTDIGANATQGCYADVCTGSTTVPAGEALMVYVTANTYWAGS